MKILNKIANLYFTRPVLYDYLISILLTIIIFFSEKFRYFKIPKDDKMMDISSDIGSIGLTISGFILTLLTILITFKNNEDVNEKELNKGSNAFQVFFASPLYFISVNTIKNAVISLVIVSLSIYISKLFLRTDETNMLFYFNIIGLFIILTTFFRSLFILSKIIMMQQIKK